VSALSDLLMIPEREPLDRAIFIEPKDNGQAGEEARQAAFVSFIRRHAKRMKVYANVNAAKRGPKAIARAKREGMKAGAPDLTCFWAGGVAWIEFKDARAGVDTKANEAQVSFLNDLHRAGHNVAVFRTAERAIEWLRDLGAPVPEFKK
jgi:hypothetical protein